MAIYSARKLLGDLQWNQSKLVTRWIWSLAKGQIQFYLQNWEDLDVEGSFLIIIFSVKFTLCSFF